jgi:hypothetical protein
MNPSLTDTECRTVVESIKHSALSKVGFLILRSAGTLCWFFLGYSTWGLEPTKAVRSPDIPYVLSWFLASIGGIVGFAVGFVEFHCDPSQLVNQVYFWL